MRLTLCLRNNTMSDTSSIHFLAVNHGGCKQTLRLVFPTDAHYTQQRALAMGFICHFLQITSLNHLILTATRQKRKCKDIIVANKGRVLSCYRDRSQLRSFKMDAVSTLFKDRALRKRLLPEFDGKSTCDIFCKWPRKRWPTYLYIDS